MKILGALKKSRVTRQVFNLNSSSAVFSDNTGRHTVTTGVGVTSVGGKATFAASNEGVIVADNTYRDFDARVMGDFRFSFKFQMTADPDTLSLLFNLELGGWYVLCSISESAGSRYVSLSASNVGSVLRHPQVQNAGDPERTVIVSRVGLVYSLSVDGTVVHQIASALPDVASPGTYNLRIGGWAGQDPIWDFIGTIRDFVVVTTELKTLFNAQFATDGSDSSERFTTTNTGGVTFSGGRAVWAVSSPPRYLTTVEDFDWEHTNTLVVTTKVNISASGIGKSLWTISNSAADSYIRASYIDANNSFAVQANGTNIFTSLSYPTGTDHTLVVKYYSTGFTEIYVNGVLDGTGSLPVLAADSRKLYIGYSPTFTAYGLLGTMDYLKVEVE